MAWRFALGRRTKARARFDALFRVISCDSGISGGPLIAVAWWRQSPGVGQRGIARAMFPDAIASPFLPSGMATGSILENPREGVAAGWARSGPAPFADESRPRQ